MTGFLDKVYQARDGETTRDLYDAWAASYEEEVADNGYVTPARCGKALAEVVTDTSQPLLDFGCGTGLSGLALKMAGFETLDGVDLSAEMLAQAKDKDVYRKLTQIAPDAKVPKGYGLIAAIGVIGAGAAPISVFHSIMHSLNKGGHLVFSFNDHALEDPANEGALMEWLDCGAAHLRYKDYGDHLPGVGMKSNVYVVEKN